MPKILTEKQGNFNPILRGFFECPVCGGVRFVYVVPFGGLWCEKCNAKIEVGSTCDGLNKVSIHVYTKHCHTEEWREDFDCAWTVLWADDDRIIWMKAKNGKML